MKPQREDKRKRPSGRTMKTRNPDSPAEGDPQANPEQKRTARPERITDTCPHPQNPTSGDLMGQNVPFRPNCNMPGPGFNEYIRPGPWTPPEKRDLKLIRKNVQACIKSNFHQGVF